MNTPVRVNPSALIVSACVLALVASSAAPAQQSAPGMAPSTQPRTPAPPAPPAPSAPAGAAPGSQPGAGSVPPGPVAAGPGDENLSEIAVYMKDGQRVSGLLVSVTAAEVVVRVAGIDTRLPMSEVDRYEILPSVLDRYEQLRRTIGDDPDDIVHLAQWLQGREQYSLALSELMRALDKDPNHAEARRLKPIIEQQLILKTRAGRPRAPEPAPSAPATTDPVRGAPAIPHLSADDINLIKLYEIDLAANPRVIIPRDTVLRMLEVNAGHPLVPVTREGREAILRKPPAEILDLMFKLQAREFYPQVQVLDQPPSIRYFRDNVARTWLMSCATSQCHGGLEAGRLVLESKNPNSDATVYTNLLILERFRTALAGRGAADPRAAPADEQGRSGRPLINWDNPGLSPLLQVGLPRQDSFSPHPPVPRPGPGGPGAPGTAPDTWKPAFASTDDKLFKRTVEWLRMMYRPRPEYPVQYSPLRPFEPPGAPGRSPTPSAVPPGATPASSPTPGNVPSAPPAEPAHR